MSEWNRYGRDDDRRRYGSDDEWDRRGRGEQDRQFGQGGEGRSFGEREHWQDGGRGQSGRHGGGYNYSNEGYGSSGYGPESSLQPGGGTQVRHGGGSGYGAQGYGREGYGVQGGQSMGGGQAGMARNWGGQAAQGYGGSPYGGRHDTQRSGQGGGGMMAGNERLQHVSDGDADRGFMSHLGGAGQHRGRGPKNYTRSDDRIREDVNDRLSDDDWLDASEIDVEVSKGEVTLSGSVSSREDKRRAEDIAEQVSGVKHVQNNLRIQAAGQGQQGQASTGALGQATTHQATTGGSDGQRQS